ncbi:MAG: hypothetical protein LBC31_06030 [Treponema sp.]|jgi:hypothetical protein|nr:hypothetical protein [Treponema sp.]
MKTAKSMCLFAAAAAVLLSGCFNPAGSIQDETSPVWTGSQTDAWEEPDPFEVKVWIGGEAGNRNAARRSIAGPDDTQLAVGADSVRNFAQLIVMDEERNITAVVEERRRDDSPTVDFTVDSLPFNKTYHFLLLMGHWERDYANETPNDGEYRYLDRPPTLLAAGLASRKIAQNDPSVTISMHSIQVDTKFIPDNLIKYKETEPELVNGHPKIVPLETGATWNFTWTVRGEGAYDALETAQNLANLSGSDPGYAAAGLKFKEHRIMVETTRTGTPLQDITGSITGKWDSDIKGVSVTRKIGMFSNGNSGWGYFNLNYIPFNKFEAGDWEGFKTASIYPELYDSAGFPVWIIRNGINDEEQTGDTYFNPSKKWDGLLNGNGGVRFVATTLINRERLAISD